MRKAVADLGIHYPVAIDNDYGVWRAFNNPYWPAHYFIDAQGRIRGHHFGEGKYDESEQLIRELLTEAGHDNLPALECRRRRRGRGGAGRGQRGVARNLCRLRARGELRLVPSFAPDRPADYATPSG